MGNNRGISGCFDVICRKLAVLFLTILFVIIVPPLFIALIPLFLLRKFVSFLSKFVRPDLDKLVTTISSNLATDDIYGNPKFSLVVHIQAKGELVIEAFKAKAVNDVIGVRKVGNQLKNIELKQYPYNWMGYYFWKWDKNFDVSNHLKYYEGEMNSESKMTMEQLRKIEHKLLVAPFAKKRSPWEIIFFRNVDSGSGEDVTVLVFRFHHVLADGFAALKLLCYELVDEVPMEFIPQIKISNVSLLQRILFLIKCVKIPYEFADLIVEGYDKNDWKISKSKMSNKWNVAISNKISMDVIKEIKHGLKCSVNAIIFSAFSAAIRNTMLKNNGRIPKYVYLGVAFPLKSHPDKLRNYSIPVFLKLHVGEHDPVKRLLKMERCLNQVKNSTLPLTIFILTVVVGSMFSGIIRPINNFVMSYGITAGGSSVPGPKIQLGFQGLVGEDCDFALGPLPGSISLNFTTSTYNNMFKVRLMVNESLLDHESDVEEMVAEFIKEFHILKNCTTSVV